MFDHFVGLALKGLGLSLSAGMITFKNNNFMLCHGVESEGLEFHYIVLQQVESIILQDFVECL